MIAFLFVQGWKVKNSKKTVIEVVEVKHLNIF